MGAQHLFPVRWNGRGTEAVCRVVGYGLAFFCLSHPIPPIRSGALCGGVWSACRRGLCRLCFPLAGARQSRYHGDKHSQQTKTRDDSVMLKEICSCN